MGSALGLPASQLIGVDIYEEDAGGEYTRHVLADPTEVRVRVRVRVRQP